MSQINNFLSRSLIQFQGVVQKIDNYRSTSVIRSHANKTVKRGRDLSTPKKSFGLKSGKEIRELQNDHTVRFLSDTLQQNTNKMSGWLRRTTQSEKLIKTAQYPMRFVLLNSKTSRLQVMNKPGQAPKQDFDLAVASKEKILNVEAYKSESGLDMPSDFSFPFSIKFHSGQFMLFWAKTAQERGIWINELSKLIQPNLEQDTIGEIDQNHYGYITSQKLQPIKELKAVPEPFVFVNMLKQPFTKELDEQTTVLSQTTHFKEYKLHNGQRAYMSSTLRQTPQFLAGYLYLISSTSKNYERNRQTIVAYSFKSQKLFILSDKDVEARSTAYFEIESLKQLGQDESLIIEIQATQGFSSKVINFQFECATTIEHLLWLTELQRAVVPAKDISHGSRFQTLQKSNSNSSQLDNKNLSQSPFRMLNQSVQIPTRKQNITIRSYSTLQAGVKNPTDSTFDEIFVKSEIDDGFKQQQSQEVNTSDLAQQILKMQSQENPTRNILQRNPDEIKTVEPFQNSEVTNRIPVKIKKVKENSESTLKHKLDEIQLIQQNSAEKLKKGKHIRKKSSMRYTPNKKEELPLDISFNDAEQAKQEGTSPSKPANEDWE